ncbi:ABC transporter ATP-binding protein [Frankia sp. Cpl3]|nr:ABC transporter ATP-binding protein [Frankia sp. Cpl3]
MAGSGHAHLREGADPLLAVRDLVVSYPARRGRRFEAVSSVSFDVARGETLGVVGESGSGKSSVARAILQLPRPTAGTVHFEGTELGRLRGEGLRRARPRLQPIAQDPRSALNPRRTARQLVADGLDIWGRGTGHDTQVDAVLEAVGFDPAAIGGRRPAQLSGGQCQRLCIARALALEPALLLCDEPVSSLDVSAQAQVLTLLRESRRRYGLTMVFISHDLAVVRVVADRVLVMYRGKVCEVAETDRVFAAPAHPYTALLLASHPEAAAPPAPEPGPADRTAPGRDTPAPGAVTAEDTGGTAEAAAGCRFRALCPRATALCASEEPAVRPTGPGQWVACHHPLDPPGAPASREGEP